MKRMTESVAKKLTKPGRYAADTTLYLKVSPSGAKSWVQRIMIAGKRHDIGLGGYPVVRVDEAKMQALENRRLVQSGGDPLRDKHKSKLPTFKQASEYTLKAIKGRWKNSKTAANWRTGMETYAYPVIGEKSIDKVGREDVLRILTPIWSDKTETARKLRHRMNAVFSWALAHGYIETNPAGEAINGALPKMPSVKSNFRALHYRDVPGALETIAGSAASIASRLCFRFVVLTACRSGEARGAAWDEIDLDSRIWSLPGKRMKTGKPHRVPLSDAALEVLDQARLLADGSGLLFPSPHRSGKQLSDMTLTKLLRDNGLAEKATVHGFRSSFRDWCADTGKPRELAEAALAHIVGGVEGAYFRSDIMARREQVMEQWADFVTSTGAEVVSLRHG